VQIDFDGIEHRIVALSLPARSYSGLTAGRAGFFYVMEAAEGGGGGGGGDAFALRPQSSQARKTGRQRGFLRSLGQRRKDAAAHGRSAPAAAAAGAAEKARPLRNSSSYRPPRR
jgi:hypothetical protein